MPTHASAILRSVASFLRYNLLLAGACLGWAAAAGAAEPILVPEFTPASPAEFAIAGMLGSQVQDRLLQDGHIVLTEQVIAPVVGGALDSCAARAGCPSDVLPRLPARMAVVVMIGRAQDGALVGYLRLFVGADPRPAISQDLPILPGQEYLFADQVSASVRQLLAMVGPSPDAVLMAAARLISGQPPAPVAPAPIAPVPVAPVPSAPVPQRADLDEPVAPPGKGGEPGASGDTRPLSEILAGTDVYPRNVAGVQGSLRRSGKDPRDWMFEESPHGGRLVVDVQAGLGIGDIERGADLRVTLDESGETIEKWYQEGPYYARRPRGGISLGYAPSAWFDLGLFGGVQYGNRVLTTGYARKAADGSVTITNNAAQHLQALQVVIEPRARLYLVPTGPAKPYLFTGPEIRGFDRYKIELSPGGPEYLTPPGGVMFGWNGGGGLMIDPGPIIGFFAEGAYTRLFGLRSGPAQEGFWSYAPPPPPVPTHGTIAIVGGVQFRI